jgi:hypothetical protein
MLFVNKIESNEFNLDLITLKSGKVLGIDSEQVALYESMQDFEDMKTVDRQSINLLSPTPTLVDQIATLIERVAKLEAHATTRAREIRDAINHALDTHDFSDAIAKKLDDYDFSDAIGNEVEEALRNKTITIR